MKTKTNPKTIALAFSTPDLARGAYLSPHYGKKYPGAGWMRHLHKTHNVMAAESVLHEIKQKRIDPKDVIVIQEDNNALGCDLVGMGADPRILICLESPIYASDFYDSIGWEVAQQVELCTVNAAVAGSKPAFPANFKHRLLFSGGTEHVKFPSFDDDDFRDPLAWDERKLLCMVTSNKHYGMLHKSDSSSRQKAIDTQLHDARYRAAGHFLKELPGAFDLYGRGWGEVAKEVDNKLQMISRYKFCLCFENGRYPGYVTEKIFDCLIAGVVPIYLGAPDITDHVPQKFFIDGAAFESLKALEDHLLIASKIDPMETIRSAQIWLRTSEGREYNNRVFAQNIARLCE